MAIVQQEQVAVAECGKNGEPDVEDDEHEPEEEGTRALEVRNAPSLCPVMRVSALCQFRVLTCSASIAKSARNVHPPSLQRQTRGQL